MEEYVAKPVVHYGGRPVIIIVRKLARHFGQRMVVLTWPCYDDGTPRHSANTALRRSGYAVTFVRVPNGLDSPPELVLRLPSPNELINVLPYPDPKGALW